MSTLKALYVDGASWSQVSNPISVLDITRYHA